MSEALRQRSLQFTRIQGLLSRMRDAQNSGRAINSTRMRSLLFASREMSDDIAKLRKEEGKK